MSNDNEPNRFTATANEFARVRDFGGSEEDDFSTNDGVLPQMKEFVKELYTSFSLRRQHEVQNAYEVKWKEVTWKYFPDTPVPEADDIAHLVKDDQTFLTLYKLLYFRHLLMKAPTDERPPRMSEFSEAWDAYREFFDLVITAARTANREQSTQQQVHEDTGLQAHTLSIPPVWVYDLLNDFVYHFEGFHGPRNKQAASSEETEAGGEETPIAEREEVLEKSAAVLGKVQMDLDEQELDEVWRTEEVLRYLYRTVAETGIREKLSAHTARQDAAASSRSIDQTAPQGPKYVFGKSSLTQGAYIPQTFPELAGYFALISLLRLHTKLGDYGSALDCASYIDLSAESFIARVPKAHITLYYYYGFSLLMAGRHADAAALISRVLLFFERTVYLLSPEKGGGQTSGSVRRRVENMTLLLAIPLALSGYSGTKGMDPRSLSLLPGVEEIVARKVVDKHGELMTKIANAASVPLPYSIISKAARIFPEPAAKGDDKEKDEDKEKVYDENLTEVAPEVRRSLAAALEAITSVFEKAAPRYLVPVVSVGRPTDTTALVRRQLAVLREETLARAIALPHIRSYMRLYTSIDTVKLSTFLGLPQEQIPELLLGLKIKSWQRQGIAAASDGENTSTAAGSQHASTSRELTKVESFSGRSHFPFASSDLIHFFVSGNMVQVEESRKTGDASQMFAHSVLEFASIKQRVQESMKEEQEKKASKTQSAAQRISAVKVSSRKPQSTSFQQGSKFGNRSSGSYASRVR